MAIERDREQDNESSKDGTYGGDGQRRGLVGFGRKEMETKEQTTHRKSGDALIANLPPRHFFDISSILADVKSSSLKGFLCIRETFYIG